MAFPLSSSALVCCLALAAGGELAPPNAAAGETPRAVPSLEVHSGKVEVFAGEAWLELKPKTALPQPLEELQLRLGSDARARLILAGAGVELRGPLLVKSHAALVWALRLEGSGSAQLEARSTCLQVELPGAAWVELSRSFAWIAGQPDGSWRVGCDAGEALSLRAPPGARWDAATTVSVGAALRVIPAGVQPPASLEAPRSQGSRAWHGFSWPWQSVRAPDEFALAKTCAFAACRALQELHRARLL
jgi:hypothetical protein